MRNKVLCALFLSFFVLATLGQSIELLYLAESGPIEYLSSSSSPSWYNLNVNGDYQIGIKASDSHFVMSKQDRQSVLLIDAATSAVTTIPVRWDSLSTLPGENDRFIQDVARDSAGRIWILTGNVEVHLYKIALTGELTGPYLSFDDHGQYHLNLFMDYNDGKLYILCPGDVYLGAQTTGSTPVLTSAPTGIVIVALPETESGSFPASAVSTTRIPFNYVLVHKGFDFDNQGRLYTYGFENISRFDGSSWDSIGVSVETHYMAVARINRLAFGPDDRIYIAGQFNKINGQSVSNFASFIWAQHPIFDNLNGGVSFEVVDMDSDYIDGTKANNGLYIAGQSQVYRFDASARILTQLAKPPITIVSAIKASRSTGGSTGTGNHNIIVFDPEYSWLPGSTQYSWGNGGSCAVSENTNSAPYGYVLTVTSGAPAPNDWYGCGYYYYLDHNNVFLDFTGVTGLRFMIKTDVIAKIEVQFDANTSTPASASANPNQDPKKAFIYVSNTNGALTEVVLPLTDRTSDELAHVYGPFLITIFGTGTAVVSDIEAIRP